MEFLKSKVKFEGSKDFISYKFFKFDELFEFFLFFKNRNQKNQGMVTIVDMVVVPHGM